jgi:DNA-binding transcriptional ArsR family regulator
MSPSRVPPPRQLAEAVSVFAALADMTRLGLLRRLSAEGRLSITRLSEGTGMTRQAITRHLDTLGDAGLVHDIRQGRERLWELDPERLEGARRALDRIAAQWDDAVDRLKTMVEED